jgi:hypothetical protein
MVEGKQKERHQSQQHPIYTVDRKTTCGRLCSMADVVVLPKTSEPLPLLIRQLGEDKI